MLLIIDELKCRRKPSLNERNACSDQLRLILIDRAKLSDKN